MKQLFLLVGICAGIQISEAKLSALARMITIQNAIKDSDLKKMGQTPHFTLSIDGKQIDSGNSITLAYSNKLVVRYEYSFLKGVYRGANDVTFSFDNPQQTNYILHFSWKKEHEPWRVSIAGATAINKKKVS